MQFHLVISHHITNPTLEPGNVAEMIFPQVIYNLKKKKLPA